MPMPDRVALLIDGENIPPNHAQSILNEVTKLGRVDVRRVYGNACTPSPWHAEQSLSVVHTGTGKNATDMMLVIDAMELALVGGFNVITIVSSDRDYTHVATRLRERGITVIGLGEDKTPDSFRLACSRFIVLHGTGTETTANTSDMDSNIRAYIAANSKKGQGIPLTDLAPAMHRTHGILISTFPEKTWRGYLNKRPELYDLDPKGPNAMVRFKPSGFRGDTCVR